MAATVLKEKSFQRLHREPTLNAHVEAVVTGYSLFDTRGESDGGYRETKLLPSFLSGKRVVAKGWSSPLDPEMKSVPNRSDRRTMGRQFLAGICAATDALAMAGYADVEKRRSVASYTATRYAERDEDLDQEIFSSSNGSVELLELVMSKLRPTLFLAQLPNLLAGNLAIVSGLKGTSRTFLGEELAGVNALWCATKDVANDRVNSALVGGALNASRESYLRWLVASGHKIASKKRPGESSADDGMIPGSAAAFLVLESLNKIEKNSDAVATVQVLKRGRQDLGTGAKLRSSLRELHALARSAQRDGAIWVVTNSHGVGRTEEELTAWSEVLDMGSSVIPTRSVFGSAMEVDCIAGVCEACRILSDQAYVSPSQANEQAPPSNKKPKAILVLTRGLDQGFGATLVKGVSK